MGSISLNGASCHCTVILSRPVDDFNPDQRPVRADFKAAMT
jgi:hypothetical protein